MEIIRTLQVVFGIGLVIFVHEAGHFFAARLCKVRVDVFSLGFGPPLISRRWGSTLYQVAAIPIGGYVKMAGEMPDGSGRPARGDELWSKTVWQRFFIYSGGVIMNVVFALIAFPIVFSVGVPVFQPVISAPAKGMPAWYAGLEAGSEIVAIEGEAMFDFGHVITAVALGDEGSLEITVRPPGSDALETHRIEPVADPDIGIHLIGVGIGDDPGGHLRIADEGPARDAGLENDDVFLGIAGGLAAQTPAEQLLRAFRTRAPFTLLAKRGEQAIEALIAPDPMEVDAYRFGFAPLQNQVQGLRPNPDLESLGLSEGERIVSVDGHPVANTSDWLEALLRADGAPRVDIQGVDGSLRQATFARALDQAAAVQAERDLYLTFQPDATLIEVSPDQASARAGLRTGDRLLTLDDGKVGSWEELFSLAQTKSEDADAVRITYERQDAQGVWQLAELSVAPALYTIPAYGFDLAPARSIYRAATAGAAIRQGFGASKRFMVDAWLSIKKMVLGRVGTQNMGGIITISRTSYSVASEGLAKLFFFLCLLSINLAFINVLPIPVLDGGHLLFCVVEAIKGSPVSERTLGYSQVVGLVLILTLMVYVTYQDVLKLLT